MIQLDYTQLLKDLYWFNADNQRVKTRWAQNFYRHHSSDEANI